MTAGVMSFFASLEVESMAVSVLRWLALSLVYGTLLAVLTWVILKTAFRRSGLLFAGAIWTVVLLKFVVPSGPGVAFSLASLTDTVQGAFQLETPANAAVNDGGKSGEVQFVTIFENGAAPTGVASTRTAKPFWTVPVALTTLYLAVVLVITALRFHRYACVLRKTRRLPRAESAVVELVSRTCQSRGLRRTLDVRVSDEAAAPFVVGLLRPVLVLSPRHLADAAETEAVILHEIGHIRPFDVLLRCLQCLVGTLLFFWPVVAWVNRRIDLAREHACDDWALSHGKLSAAEYARCLLRALQPVRSSWSIYRPAAMAANRRHVERRIEMILQHSGRTRHARSLGVGALLVVGAWAVFTLSGSKPVGAALVTADAVTAQSDTGSKKIIVTRVNQSGDGQMKVKVVQLNEGELKVNVEGAGEPIDVVVPTGEVKARAMAFVAADGAPHCVMGGAFTRIDEETLAQFGRDFPSADLDADGKISPQERDGYLTAVASLAPAAVIQKFPNADRNADGTLDMTETARLVMGDFFNIQLPGLGEPHVMAFAGTGQGIWQTSDGDCLKVAGEPVEVRVVAVGGEGEEKECEAIVIGANGSEAETIELDLDCDVEVQTENGDNAKVATKTIVVRPAEGAGEWKTTEGALPAKIAMKLDHPAMADMPFGAQDDVAAWLKTNVVLVPTVAQLRAAATAIELAPLAQFKEMHPEADADKNGAVTAEEREAFLAEEMKGVRAKVLEQFPDADANKDGELTETEMHEFFSTQAGAGGIRAMRFSGPTEKKMIFVGDAKPATVEVTGQPVKCKVRVRTTTGDTAEAEATATTERP